MNAEHLLDLLEKNNLIAPDLLEGLRARIADVPESISAEDFAHRLIEHGVLTPSLAEMALRQLNSEAPRPAAKFYSESGKGRSSSEYSPSPPPEPLKNESYFKNQHTPNQSAPAQNAPPSARESVFPVHQRSGGFTRGNYSRKKKAENPWDSKLILFGAGGLLVLLLLGFFLFGSLFRRSAETMFSKADQAYRDASYSEAIIGYTEFLSAFPNDTDSSTARIRRALARIRVLVDAKSDWIKSLDTAVTELESVENEPNFFEEASAELGNLLPAIAVGLADEAREKTSIQHAEQAEKALALIDKYLPRSLRPVEKLAEVQYRIDGVRRRLVQADVLREAKISLEQKLSVPNFDARQAELCYDLVAAVLSDHPELERDETLLSMVRNISKNEARAVVTLTGNQLPEREILNSGTTETAATTETAVLFQQAVRKQPALDDASPVFLHAGDALFGLDAEDGRPLWKRKVEAPGEEAAEAPAFMPLPKTKRNPHAGVLLFNVATTGTMGLEQLDGRTGAVLWRLPVGEPFYVSELASDSERSMLGLATRSGKILTVFFQSGENDPTPTNEVRGYRLPRPLSSAPLIDPAFGTIFQFGKRDTLFQLPIDPEAGSSKFVSRYFGQFPSTVRIPPFRFGEHLLVLRQKDVRSCVLDVFSPTVSPTASPKGEIVQSLPVRGLVDTPPAVDGSFLVLTTDTGETVLFEQSGEPTKPLRQIAQGSAGGEANRRGTLRYAVLVGKNVWIADRQLMRFEPQLAQSRLLPQESVRKDIVTTGRPYRRGNVLFHAFRQPGLGGHFLEAVALDTASILWETELAEPIVMEPRRIDDDAFRVMTSTGKSYRIDPKETDDHFLGTPTVQLPRGSFGAVPLGNVVALADGFEAWTPRTDRAARTETATETMASTRSIVIFDPKAPETSRFRPVLLPAPMAAPPTALTGNLLVPLTDGQLVLLDPKSGRPAATPYTASLSPDKPSVWTAPVVVKGDEFLIGDNAPDSQGRFSLHRIVSAAGNFVRKETIPVDASIATATAVLDRLAVLVDGKNTLRRYRLGEGDEKTKAEPPEPLGTACVWGPHTAGNVVVFATPDGRLHAVNVEGKRISTASAVPVGTPLVESDGIVLTSATGLLWKVDPAELKTLFTVETGVPTTVGPFRFGNDYYLSGRDGTVYRSREK